MAEFNRAEPINPQFSINSLLLTGASGYLGTYVLNRLLATTDYHIYCVLRCSDPKQGLERLQKAAAEKGLNANIDSSRITIMSGELSQPRLGVSDDDYQHLCEYVDAIIHNASIINLMDPLSALYPTNVEGVTQILSLASTRKIKPIHYVSTIGVHHALAADIPQPVVEATPVVDWHIVDLTYEQSKIMAETLFGHARKRGVPVNILRPGTITWANDSRDPFINDDAFLKFYRACLAIKAYPSSTLAVNIVPVDYVADCIAAIANSETGNSNNYHVVAEESSQVETLYQWFNDLGCTIKPMEFNTWKQTLNDNFVLSFVNLYFRQGMEDGGHHQYSTDNLQAVTRENNITGFTVTKEYLEPLTKRFTNADDE
jgi:thioester reductase-like protein